MRRFLVTRVVKWELSCMLKMVIGLKSGWGRTWFWHAFWMACRHTLLSKQMAEVRWAVYCATVAVGGGIDVMQVCWNA